MQEQSGLGDPRFEGSVVASDPYDERPYTDHAYVETHPSRLSAVARLSGWVAPAVEKARVLELGCGRGGNLLPMAAGLPRATLVGVDRSKGQIDEARRVAVDARLDHVTFVCLGFEEFDGAGGPFDYVICHGVMSWIPPASRGILFERIARSLGPGGVAHVSFNVLPGWYSRLAARDWLRFAVSSLGATADRAGHFVSWLREQVSPEHADYRRQLEAVSRRLGETDPAYAQHEYLADEHHPLSTGEFLAEAAAAGLTYLGDAMPATCALELLSEEVRGRARELDPPAAQQFIDFVQNVAFRRAMLVRADEAHRRSWRAPRLLDRTAIESLYVASRLRARTPRDDALPLETFEERGQVVQISDPVLRRALHGLAQAAPRALAFDELARAIGSATRAHAPSALTSELFDVWLATGAIDLLAAAPDVEGAAGPRPIACPVARWHARHGGAVTNRLHQEVAIPDVIVRWVLARLDGTRTIADLAREAASVQEWSSIGNTEIAKVVAASVDRLAACAVLVPS